MATNDSIFGEVIYAYTRKQAIEDGTLVDVTATAMLAGFRVPVAVTCAVFAALPDARPDDVLRGKVDSLCIMLGIVRKAAAEAAPAVDRIEFEHAGEAMYALCHGGDNGEMVITIMLEGED